jgi:hypothetical protein
MGCRHTQGGRHQCCQQRNHGLGQPRDQQMGCGHSRTCYCCVWCCDDVRCCVHHHILVRTPVGTPLDCLCTPEDQGWRDVEWVGPEAQAGAPVWFVV